MSGLKLRSDITRHWNKGVWPARMTASGGKQGGGGGGGMFNGLGFDRAYRFRRDPPGMGRTRAERGLMGLGDDPETILNTPDPVGMYIKAIQSLISTLPEYHDHEGTPPSKRLGVGGRWDLATHNGVLDFLASVYGTEDLYRFPAWGQDPGFMAFFVVDIFFGGFELEEAFEQLKPFYYALGLPTTSMRDAVRVLGQRENAERLRVLIDRVVRYIIGAEGGQVYGSKPVQYEGIAAGVAAVVGSVSAILLVG